MPIRINLLAEALAAEEQRRKDPVKRAIWVCVFIIFLFLLWSTTLQLQIISEKSDVSRKDGEWNRIEKKFTTATDNLKNSVEIQKKIESLTRLSTNRFLWGSVLHALQQTSIPQVQITRIRTEQQYLLTDPVAPKKSSGAQMIPGKPATSTEKINLFIDARDRSAQSEESFNKLKAGLISSPYLKAFFQKSDSIKLGGISAPIPVPSDTNRFLTTFTMECYFQPTTRYE